MLDSVADFLGKLLGSNRFSLLAYGLKALPGPPILGDLGPPAPSSICGTSREDLAVSVIPGLKLKESTLAGTFGVTGSSMGRGGMCGGGELVHDDDKDLGSKDICDCRDRLLSGVVIKFVDVLMLSGDVMTPGLVKDLLCENMADISIWVLSL